MSYIKNKIDRLFQSRNILKLKYIIHRTFKEKDIGNLGFNFEQEPNRIQIIQKIIDEKKYKSYLEIGCFSNELFNKILITEKIGVDPVSGGTIKKTSDEFFLNNNKFFDIIFIDGLHHYNQVKKDIDNSLKFLNKDGVILLHDCLPNTVFDQAVPRCTYKWNGDVWKSIVESRCREDIDTYTCFADQGLGIIFKRPNKNKLDLNIKDFSKLKFKDYFDNHNLYMNIIKYDKIFDIFD